MTGAARPTAAQKGRPIDLDAAMKAKMEHAFGDLSAVKLYESPAVGEAGAEAVAQGNEIAFAPGMTDFSSRSGQERLGHELSHVMSQRSGQVRGAGFLANPALEARADREGAMAAAGEPVYAGPVTRALSGAAPSPTVAGPMQAQRGKQRLPTEEEKQAGLDEIFHDYKDYDQEIHADDYDSGARYNKESMDRTVNALIAKGEDEYDKEQMAIQRNIAPADDDFEDSFDAGPAQEDASAPQAKNNKEAAMQKIKRDAMIRGLTKHSREAVLKKWRKIETDIEDPDPQNEDQSEDAVMRRKVSQSKTFNYWMNQKMKYSDMSYEDLERKYKRTTDKDLRNEFASSFYARKWWKKPFVKFDLWRRGVYKNKKS